MRSGVVTGAALGIGRAIALKLVAEGIHVVAVDWNRDALSELDRTVTELGGSLEPLHADDDGRPVVSYAFRPEAP